MAGLSEQTIINKIAGHARSIEGVQNAYDFANNPDNLSGGMMPALVFYPAEFNSSPAAHRNLWETIFEVRATLFVAELQARGGRYKFLENDAMPFGFKFRQKFQTDTVIQDILGMSTGVVTAWLTNGRYGAGGANLTFNGKPYIGWVFRWTIREVN